MTNFSEKPNIGFGSLSIEMMMTIINLITTTKMILVYIV